MNELCFEGKRRAATTQGFRVPLHERASYVEGKRRCKYSEAYYISADTRGHRVHLQDQDSFLDGWWAHRAGAAHTYSDARARGPPYTHTHTPSHVANDRRRGRPRDVGSVEVYVLVKLVEVWAYRRLRMWGVRHPEMMD